MKPLPTTISVLLVIAGSEILFALPAIAQPDTNEFERLTTRDGLADNWVTGIAQDQQGFMWFGTWNGLSKYDGYEFTNYRHNPSDSTSLAANIVETLYVDREAVLWVGTPSAGLDRFDPTTETFAHFSHDPEDSTSLSNNYVTAILEDREGTLWVGTNYMGLNRFDRDTETFKHYRYDPDDPTSISDNKVRVLYEDSQGTLWVGTGAPWSDTAQGTLGLNRFDRATGAFTRYHHDADDDNTLISDLIGAIYEDSQGTFWVGTWGDGLHTMDRETGDFTRYTYDPANPNRPHGPRLVSGLAAGTGGDVSTYTDFCVCFLHEDRSGALWIGGFGGINRYDRTTGTLTHYEHGDFSEANTDWKIYESREGVLWIATWNGLYRIRPDASPFELFRHDPEDPNSLSDNHIRDVLEDAKGILWIGTGSGGLNRYDRVTKTFTYYRHDPKNSNSLSSDNARALYESPNRPGVLWIGTWGGGLNRLETETGTFTHYRHDSGDANSLSNNSVNVIYEAPSEPGVLWIGTQGGGLNRFDTEAEAFTTYTMLQSRRYRPELFDELEMLDREDRAVAALLKIGNDENRSQAFELTEETSLLVVSLGEYYERRALDYGWIEDENGQILWQMNADKTRFAGGNALNRAQIDEIRLKPGAYMLRYSSDRLRSYSDDWYNRPPDAPEHWGIQVYSMQGRAALLSDEDKSEALPSLSISNNNVTSILEDSAGALWIGSARGLNKLQRESGVFTSYLLDHSIDALHEDRRGRFWLGTDGGLMYFDRIRAKQLTGVEEGEAPFALTPVNRYRVSGILEDDRGMLWLRAYTPGLDRYDPDSQIITRFDAPTGTAAGFGSTIKSRSGELFFGGGAGLMYFFPDKVLNMIPPSVALTGLRIFNEPVQPGPKAPIDVSMTFSKSVELTHRQRDITIEYAGLHYNEPTRNRYMYRLEGYDTDWVQAGTQRSARYTGLPPGSYTFRVKAANSDGVWNEEGASIAITVLPPWWRTWWAYSLFGLLFAVGLFAVNRYQRRRLVERERRQAHIREAQIKAEAAEEHAHILEEVDQMKSRFFANLSHEFRTPLTLLLGPVQDALKGRFGVFDDSFLQELGIMQRSGLRLQALIDQLLDLSRLEAGRLALHCREYDLVTFTRTLVLSFSSLAERKRITLLFEGPEDPLSLYFDADKLEKILVNLLSNAFKFTPEHGKIYVRISDEGAFAHIRVSDTGVGIPAEELPYIFDRFRQGDASATRKHEGAGIGLALAKELVELHGGTIEVESDAGFGATFIVRLLAGRDHFDDEDLVDETYETATLALAEAALATAQSIEGFGRNGGEESAAIAKTSTVLIVEDNADVRTYLRGHLSEAYRVIEATNGAEGLESARAEKPELIVSDVMMPVMDGYELCWRLKEDEQLNHIPVVLLTARVGEEDRIEGLELGADDYLSKPFSAEELLVRVENLIRLRSLLRARFSAEVQLGPSRIVVSSLDQEFLDRLQAVVEREMENSLFGVEQLAEEVGMSVRQLYRKLKEVLDLTPAGYIRLMRLARAAQLLEQRAGTISEIAYRVGFQDPTYFSKLFRQSFGMLPSQYPADLT